MRLSDKKILSLIKKSRYSFDKKNVYGLCPWCGQDEFGISLEDNHRFNCFRKKKCGETGNIYKLLKYLNKFQFLEKEIDIRKKLDSITIKKNIVLSEEKTIKPPIGFKRIYESEYLESRGFNEFDLYEVGITNIFQSYRNYVFFLVNENSELKGYVGRYCGDIEEKKYINSKSTNFENLLFGIDELSEETKTVIITEGIFDKINVSRIFIEENDIKCVCTFGAKISLVQIEKIKQKCLNLKTIYLMHESDVLSSVKKTGLKIKNRFDNVFICYLPKKDPGEMNSEEVKKCISNAYDVLDFNLSKVKLNQLNV